MDSENEGETNQTAVAQAEMVEEVLNPYGSVDAFAAVGCDNTQSSIIMRELIAQQHPGIVILK